MNLQGMTVIFAIILLPIILVTSVYIQGQIDTIQLQTKYDSMLINATHDAVTALERNIANEDLSTVSDSLRSMIEASNNVFTNSLSINMGASNASKNYIRPYIPSLLYTLYDGFYIYSPTSVPKIAEDKDGTAKKSVDPNTYGQLLYEKKGGGETVNIKDAKQSTEYVLKSYIYYNANYANGDINISVKYSLDNYISISGTIGDVYYSKSGYLINPGLVESITLLNDIDGNRFADGEVQFNLQGSKFNNDEEVFYGKYQDVIEKLSTNGKDLLALKDEKIISDFCKLNGIRIQVVLNVPSTSGSPKITITSDGTDSEFNKQAIDAICYYGKAKIFSDWVNKNLRSIQPSTYLKNAEVGYVTTYMEDSTTKYLKTTDNIFKILDDSGNLINDPENPTSAFCQHRREVIKSSIQYNLNNAISNYSDMSQSGFEYEMPIMSENEWDVILSNVTMVSFMQGMPCKGKTYNNYAIVPSTSSEITVIPDNLYYVSTSEHNNGTGYYHRIGCSKLMNNPYLGYRNIEYIYDEKLVNNQYEFDHQNLACYDCIISTNYDKTPVEALDDSKKLAYYTVLGKERNNLYKTTATVDNYGFEMKNSNNKFKNQITLSISSSRPLNEIKSIEVVIEDARTNNSRTTQTVQTELTINGSVLSKKLDIAVNKGTTQTIRWENIGFTKNENLNSLTLSNLSIDPKQELEGEIVSVKIIYK